mmetsp:Transcript_1341/g.3204  ORF Transcript_1341/g.3204 Transcript_1341/m.3204 type:complete len:219 (-) Transcript_1341:393-1049(-)
MKLVRVCDNLHLSQTTSRLSPPPIRQAPCPQELFTPMQVAAKKLNSCLTCRVCGGYFREAVTLPECCHSFCRVCVFQELKKQSVCPACLIPISKSEVLRIKYDGKLDALVEMLFHEKLTADQRQRAQFKTMQSEGGHVVFFLHMYKSLDDEEPKKKRRIVAKKSATVSQFKQSIAKSVAASSPDKIELHFKGEALADDVLFSDLESTGDLIIQCFQLA